MGMRYLPLLLVWQGICDREAIAARNETSRVQLWSTPLDPSYQTAVLETAPTTASMPAIQFHDLRHTTHFAALEGCPRQVGVRDAWTFEDHADARYVFTLDSGNARRRGGGNGCSS